ncbi:MAG: hypothetical protein NDJ89_07550 [Oligoflexia bacterium]|nr:hypothetical protein [Oligoflexia bacterium]
MPIAGSEKKETLTWIGQFLWTALVAVGVGLLALRQTTAGPELLQKRDPQTLVTGKPIPLSERVPASR